MVCKPVIQHSGNWNRRTFYSRPDPATTIAVRESEEKKWDVASAGVAAQWYLGPISSTAKKKEKKWKRKGESRGQGKRKGQRQTRSLSHTCSIQRRKKDEGGKKTVQYGQESVGNWLSSLQSQQSGAWEDSMSSVRSSILNTMHYNFLLSFPRIISIKRVLSCHPQI